MARERLCQIVTPVGMLGYTFNVQDTEEVLRGLSFFPTPSAIILDSGSTDSGPNKLALGSMSCPRSAYVRDLRRLIRLGRKYAVPVIFSSAGGDGTNAHVEELVKIVGEISQEDEFKTAELTVVGIYADIPKDLVRQRLKAEKTAGCGRTVPPLTDDLIDQTVTIVAQMGPQPFFDAMVAHPSFDIIVGGRAYDPAPYVAFCAYVATDFGKNDISTVDAHLIAGFQHMGKIMECGGLCSTPKSMGATACLYTDGSFDISPIDPASICTPLTVAAHLLYEKSRPDVLHGPGGGLDVSNAKYTQLRDGRTVHVEGSIWHPTPYTVKLEGAKFVGYRTLFLGSMRDPVLIRKLPVLLKTIISKLKHDYVDIGGEWDIDYHVHPCDAEGNVPPDTPTVFLTCEVVAETQAIATQLANTARVWTIHAPYPGQKQTSGNLGFGMGGKNELEAGACCEFSMYHLMDLEDGEERGYAYGDGPAAGRLFTWKVISIEGEGRNKASVRLDTAVAPGDVSQSAHSHSSKEGQKPDVEKIHHSLNGTSSPMTLADVAQVVRSKNSGPYEITMDVMFDSEGKYKLIKDADMLNKAAICRLYGVEEKQVIYCDWFETALAFKATIPRLRNGIIRAAGGFMENDMHGSQLHVPLMVMELPEEVRESLGKLGK